MPDRSLRGIGSGPVRRLLAANLQSQAPRARSEAPVARNDAREGRKLGKPGESSQRSAHQGRARQLRAEKTQVARRTRHQRARDCPEYLPSSCRAARRRCAAPTARHPCRSPRPGPRRGRRNPRWNRSGVCPALQRGDAPRRASPRHGRAGDEWLLLRDPQDHQGR